MMNNKLTLGSLFSGSGGFELGGILSGITPIWASEVEPFAIRVTTKRLPQVKHYGDISKMDVGNIEPVDIITFGSPCFPADTHILTDKGYKEIQNIKIGDVVLTHKGHWKRVTDVGSKLGKTIILKGNHYGLECTPNHPIYSHSKNKCKWVKAGDMLGKPWATPHSTDYLPIPIPISANKRYKPFPELSERFFYFVGRWLGDGWVRDGQRPNRPIGEKFASIMLCDSKDKLQELIDTVSCVSSRYSIEENDTCYKVKCNSRLLCDWLTENFGKYSYGKEIPSWAFSMPANYRTALLKGIFDSDGYKQDNHYKITTVSKKLALGIRLLGETLGYSSTIFFTKRPSKYLIEGRTVNQRDTYVVELSNNKNNQIKDDNLHSWYFVKSITETNEIKTVYNFTVEDDNSYIADGMVVHNCQDMSVAGKRAGLDGSRSNLFYEAIRIIKEMRIKTNGEKPRYIVWENVPGAFSSNKGEDFRCVLEAVGKVKDDNFSVPQCDKWKSSGHILGDDFSIGWRVFDAQFWGVPQRRKRIYLVADFGGRSADKILFKSEGLSGYSAEGFRSWQRTACRFKEGTNATGYDGYNGNLTGEISSTLGVNCGMSTGRNGIILNDQGGNRMDITEDVTATLRAEAHHPPCVMESAGFCTEHSANARSIGYEEEKSPTLRAGTVPATVYENHGKDARFKGPLEVAPTISATYGIGGNNQPFVVDDETPKTLKIRSGCDGGGKGALIQENKSATLGCNNDQTVFVPKVYGICSDGSNAMKSPNPHSGIYEADTSRTLDGQGGNPSCNQGGIAIVAIEGNGTRPSHHGNGYSEEDVSYTLNTTEKHGVAYGIDRAAFNQGQNALYNFAVEEEIEPTIVAKGPGAVAEPYSFYPQMRPECQSVRQGKANTLVNGTNPGYQNGVIEPTYSTSKNSHHTIAEKELANTLVATDYKDPPLVNDTDGIEYTVRRLTPTECARLQGFPDWWCSGLETEEPTTDDIKFWYDVFETHRKAINPDKKPKTIKQIIKWLKDPYSDSAEYKMWGNGIALPIVVFVLSGIVWANESEDSDE